MSRSLDPPTARRSLVSTRAVLPLMIFSLATCLGCRSEPAPKAGERDLASTEPISSHHTNSTESPSGIAGLDLSSQGSIVDLLLTTAGETPQLLHLRSQDGGGSWDEPTTIPPGDLAVAPTRRGFDPQITADGDRIVVAWTARGTSPWGTGPIGVAVSTDGGGSWQPGATPADDGTTDGHGFIDLAVMPTGEILAVWLDSRPSAVDEVPAQGLRASRSDNGGLTWSANRTLQPTTCDCCWNRLLVDESGMWVIYRDDKPRDLRLTMSNDGTNWSDGGAPGGFGWTFEGCPHVGGALAATSDRIVALSWTGQTDKVGLYASSREKSQVGDMEGSMAWSLPARLGSPRARHADLVVTPQGDLLAVWDEPGRDQGDGLAMASSTDGGAHWTLSSPIPSETSAGHPRAVATTEGVLVVWTELDSTGQTQWRSFLTTPLAAGP